jgi:N-acetylmuramoyl-L-alanine amidase
MVTAAVLTSACAAAGGSPAQARAQDPTAAAHPATPASTAPATTAGTGASTSTRRTAAARPLAGITVGIDPGHNGGNFANPGYLSQQIWNGRASETCDTTGTATDGGYTEAQYNFSVASFLRADLRRDGAKVVMTRTSNGGVGPCVNRRSQIINRARANVAIDIHADGAPAWGRGFAILEPIADGPNNGVIGSSARLGRDLRTAFLAGTPMPVSNYDGVNGITQRNDLAGLNLTTVPKVLIECGNMRNATDAAMLTSASFQQQAARAIEAAIIRFLGK